MGYPILIGDGIIKSVNTHFDFDKFSKIAVLVDHNTKKYWLDSLRHSIKKGIVPIVIPPGEDKKTIKWVEYIWKKMFAEKLDKKSLLINLGGGVIGDMGGFAATTYMRGLKFLNIPTSLMAQVDEGVGGKNGFNYCGIANCIGTTNQPIGVVIDVDVLKTLPKREFLSGFAEIIKHGLILDKKYFKDVTSKPPLDFSKTEMVKIIAKSCEIKSSVVLKDVTEQSVRKVLNFGHTIGHAIEVPPLIHGEAVSIGMLVESLISKECGLLDPKDFEKIKSVLVAANLPVTIPKKNLRGVMKKMKSDKKNVGGKINLTLLNGIGKSVYDQKIPEELIVKSMNQFIFDETRRTTKSKLRG